VRALGPSTCSFSRERDRGLTQVSVRDVDGDESVVRVGCGGIEGAAVEEGFAGFVAAAEFVVERAEIEEQVLKDGERREGAAVVALELVELGGAGEGDSLAFFERGERPGVPRLAVGGFHAAQRIALHTAVHSEIVEGGFVALHHGQPAHDAARGGCLRDGAVDVGLAVRLENGAAQHVAQLHAVGRDQGVGLGELEIAVPIGVSREGASRVEYAQAAEDEWCDTSPGESVDESGDCDGEGKGGQVEESISHDGADGEHEVRGGKDGDREESGEPEDQRMLFASGERQRENREA